MNCVDHDSIDRISILITGRGRMIIGIVIVSSLQKKLMTGNFVVTSLLNAVLRIYCVTIQLP
jgi:hypothetical protein